MSISGPMFRIDESKFREGQRGAYNVITERFAAGEKYSAIVLTTRYGKTDVARMATLRLWRDGFTKSGLLIVPSRVLVEQSLDPGKFHACLSRYQVPPEVENAIRTYRVEGPPRPTRLRNALLSAMTAQMATRHIGTLERWVESCVNGEHPHRPLVVMDEAHMQSEDNTWGEVVTRLADAGAHVVLMTATPYRSDRQFLPGFKYDPVGSDESGRRIFQVRPHWRTSLQDALAEPIPPICQVAYQPFGITGLLEDVGSGKVFRGNIRELDQSDLRPELRRAIRSEQVIQAGCRYFLTELGNRRRDPRQNNAAGIVFVDNRDESLDAGGEEQARKVERVLRKEGPGLVVRTASSDDPESQEVLASFVSGDIDILVVKQMASVGLDVDRLKVALDLSNTRTYSAVFQRMMRVGTKWEHPDYPDNPVQTAVYIGPDEPLLERVIEDIRNEEGPVPIVPSPEIPDGPVDVPPREPSDNPPLPPRGTVFIADGSELSGTLVNYSGVQAPAVYVDLADDFNANFPQASQTVDKASLANWLESRKISPTVDQVPQSRVQDITADLNLWRERCSEDGKKAVNHRYRTRMGTSDWRQAPEAYRSIRIGFWDDHKRKLSIPVSVHLEDIDEVETLQKMHANILRELGR